MIRRDTMYLHSLSAAGIQKDVEFSLEFKSRRRKREILAHYLPLVEYQNGQGCFYLDFKLNFTLFSSNLSARQVIQETEPPSHNGTPSASTTAAGLFYFSPVWAPTPNFFIHFLPHRYKLWPMKGGNVCSYVCLCLPKLLFNWPEFGRKKKKCDVCMRSVFLNFCSRHVNHEAPTFPFFVSSIATHHLFEQWKTTDLLSIYGWLTDPIEPISIVM